MEPAGKTMFKQIYTKPQARPIELITDEVLGTGCKMTTEGVGGPESKKGPCDFPAPCDGDGS